LRKPVEKIAGYKGLSKYECLLRAWQSLSCHSGPDPESRLLSFRWSMIRRKRVTNTKK